MIVICIIDHNVAVSHVVIVVVIIRVSIVSNIVIVNIVDIGQERLGKDQSYLLDSESIRRKFNWEDHISLEEGLSQTLNWIKTHLCILKKMEWDYQHKK